MLNNRVNDGGESLIERKVFTKSPIPPPPPRLTSKSSNSIINKANQRVKSMYIDNNNSKIEKEAKIPESTASNPIQKSNTSDFLVKPSNPNSGNAIKRYKTNKYSNMYRRDKRTNSVNIEGLNFRFGNLETNSERKPTESKLSVRERELGAGGASGANSDYENRSEATPDVPDQSEWEKLSENQKTNEGMIEGLKKQIDSLSKQLEHIGKEDSKIINDLSEQVEHLAKMNYVSCISLLLLFCWCMFKVFFYFFFY